MPKRIQRKRTKGWKMPADAVNVTRPTFWGNPFVHQDPAKAVEAYEQLVLGQGVFEMGPGKLQFASRFNCASTSPRFPDMVREKIHELKGKDLVCWCPLDKPCHADILLQIANQE